MAAGPPPPMGVGAAAPAAAAGTSPARLPPGEQAPGRRCTAPALRGPMGPLRDSVGSPRWDPVVTLPRTVASCSYATGAMLPYRPLPHAASLPGCPPLWVALPGQRAEGRGARRQANGAPGLAPGRSARHEPPRRGPEPRSRAVQPLPLPACAPQTSQRRADYHGRAFGGVHEGVVRQLFPRGLELRPQRSHFG